MTKKNSLFETALATLISTAKPNVDGQLDPHTLVRVLCIEKLLNDASLTKAECMRAEATLYKVLSVINQHSLQDDTQSNWTLAELHTALSFIKQHPSEDGLQSNRKVVELPMPGDSLADLQLQNTVQGFKDRRAKRKENARQEA